MRKTVAVALLFTFLFAAMSPTFAQRSSDKSRGRINVATEFESLRAITEGTGVLVRWYMKTETNISGYNVYRIGSGGKELITTSPVIGSAARFGTRPAYGEMYEFFDLDGIPGVEYLVEGIRGGGALFSSKPFASVAVKSLQEEAGTSAEVFAATRNTANSNIEHRASVLSSQLQDLVGLHEQEPDPENQRIVASKQGAKISVKNDGFYRVSAGELQAANFRISSDSTKWRLFMDGVEQSIIVGPNNEYIEFYGKGIDTPETKTRYYYLIADVVDGKRIGSKILRPMAGGAESTRYPVVARKKERTTFYSKMFNGADENFVGRYFSRPSTVVTINLTGIDFSYPTAKVKVRNFGFSNSPHAVTAKINGNELPVMTQFGHVYFGGTFTIPTEQLVEGTNELELISSGTNDEILFDSVEVSYQRNYLADDNRISFYTPGFRKVKLSGFTTSSIRVFDMTVDGHPVLISNVAVSEGDSSYTATIPSSRMMVGYGLESTALLQSPGIVENKPSTLSEGANEAGMLIVSYGDPGFMTAAQAWADYRRSSAGGSFDVKVIDVADIFDEFSYGAMSAEALKTFFKHTSTEWSVAPGYVLLIGDSTWDPLNYEGYGNFNFVPSDSVTLLLEESFTDETLGDFDEDGLSDIAIGRIPARTSNEIAIAFNKTKLFEANQQSFSRGVAFAHDMAIDFDFEGMSQQLAAKLPPGTPFTMTSAGEGNADATLISRINEGPLMVNYSGHGSTGLWANSSFFQNNSVPSLTNATNPSIFNMLTCLNGLYLINNRSSIAEVLLFAPNGGAAAGWASGSETTPDVQLIMADKYFDELATGTTVRLGDLVMESKTAATGRDVRLSWFLFGDPALKVP